MRPTSILVVLSALALAGPGCRADSASAPAGSAPPEGAAAPTTSGSGASPLDAWGRVLADHVVRGGVDYGALRGSRESMEDLEAFLGSLEGVRPGELGEEEALAFWTNAYNAVVIHHVLERYPGIESVRDVDGFFDELTFPVAEEERTLDGIEERGIEIGDERIHFAVVCASTSCPDLRDEPYEAVRLDAQLRDQTRTFLSDESKGLRFEPEENRVWLSSIFKWYAGDFTGGSTVIAFFARGGVLDWVVEHAPEGIAEELRGEDPSVRYLEYDWGLNDR